MSFPDRRTTDVFLTTAFFALACAIIYCARHILLIFVFAVFSIFAILVGAEAGGIVGIYLAIPLIASVRVIWQMCAAPETTAGHSRRHPAATTALPAMLTEPALVCVGAIPAHAKAD